MSRFLNLIGSFFILIHAAPAAEPPFVERVLPNGLRVITVEQSGAPVVAVHLWYHVGSKDEQPGRQGFAHMFEHMMFRGTDRLGPEDHFKFIRRTGGDCNAFTAFDQTVYVQTLPAEQLELALWLEAERMAFLRIDQASFDTERKVVEEERRLGLNRPYGSIPEKALAELFGDRAYGWSPIGNIAHLRAASVQELRDFWQRYYVPNNATLVIVGAIEHEAAQKLAARYFGWMPKEADPARVPRPAPGGFRARSIRLKDDNAPAPAVGALWRIVPDSHDDYIPLQLLGAILGGGESSRLYRELVAEKQLAVIALATTLSLEYDGLFAAGGIMTPFSSNGPAILQAIQAQIERVRNEPVSDKELLKARNQLMANLAQASLTVASRANQVGEAAVLQRDARRAFNLLERVDKVTAADLQRVAREYLKPEAMVTGTIEQNLVGSLFKRKRSAEEDAPITAKPETGPPPKVKAGLRRPSDFPETPPVADRRASAGSVRHERVALPNGLTLILLPRPNCAYVTAQLCVPHGSWTEAKAGTASLAAGMLTKGTSTRSEKELADELETHGIEMGAQASLDAVAVTAGCLGRELPRALRLLADVTQNPTFPDSEFEKHRKQVLTSLAISSKEPAAIAEREFRRAVFGSHPYARTPSGEPSDVAALTADDLRAWWKSSVFPERAVLLLSGISDPAEARRLVEESFGSWRAASPSAPPPPPEPPLPEPRRILLVDQPGAIQSQIRIGQRGFRRDLADYPIGRVVSDYFGESFSSRLNEVIRVQKGLTYGARGGFNADKWAGLFEISTFSKTETTAAAVQAALDEIARLRTDAPTDAELRDTKSAFRGRLALQRETPQQLAQELWRALLFGLPDDHVERTLARAETVGADECLRFVRQWLDPDRLVIVVVGEAARLKSELEKIAPVTVITRSE